MVFDMDNRTLAKRLMSLAHTLEKERASLFRVRAYRRAAETVLGWERPIKELVEQEEGRRKLADLPNVGRSLSRTIEKLVRGVEVTH
jgi:DNA polymerase/3'-5' exonuclease PolX